MTDFALTFSERGDFAASHAAEAFLRARGFSFGAKQGDDPRGILYGQKLVAKWRCLASSHRELIHGLITGPARSGPVTVTIFATAPLAAQAAVRSLKAA